MHCTGGNLLYGGLQYLYMVPAQIYSMHVLLNWARSEICTMSFLRMFIFSWLIVIYLSALFKSGNYP